MNERMKVKVIFFSEINGGRRVLPPNLLSTGIYRPHLVVGDPHQKLPLVDERNQGLEEYLGVAFIGQADALVAENEIIAEIESIFQDVDYSSLAEGVTFTIREGGAIVGSGVVLQMSL